MCMLRKGKPVYYMVSELLMHFIPDSKVAKNVCSLK